MRMYEGGSGYPVRTKYPPKSFGEALLYSVKYTGALEGLCLVKRYLSKTLDGRVLDGLPLPQWAAT